MDYKFWRGLKLAVPIGLILWALTVWAILCILE